LQIVNKQYGQLIASVGITSTYISDELWTFSFLVIADFQVHR